MMLVRQATAGVWGIDPVLGVTGDTASNPELLSGVPSTAQTNGALLLDAPTAYNGDGWKFLALPSFRLGDAKGYSSVSSNYEHLNLKGEYDTERSTVTAALGAGRDSSLYYDYLNNGSAGVRRDNATADLNWDRLMTERLEVSTDVNATRVRYAEPPGIIDTLVDYQYSSVSPTLSWATSERGKLTALASVSRYNSLDGQTESRSANLQLGFVKQLTDLWTLTASGGFSRSLNRIEFDQEFLVFTSQGPQIVVIPETFKSAQNGSVYSVNLSHQGTLLVLDAIASRQLTPVGFAFLARQAAYELRATYNLSARWSLAGDGRYVSAQNPLVQGKFYDQTTQYFSMSAIWQWTENWTLTLGASRVESRIPEARYNVASNEATLSLSRKFNHIEL